MMRLPTSSLLFNLLLLSCAACGAAPGSNGSNGKDSTDQGEGSVTAVEEDDAGPPTTAVATPAPEEDASAPCDEDAGTTGEVDASPVWGEGDAGPVWGEDGGVICVEDGGSYPAWYDDDAGVYGCGGSVITVDAGVPTEEDASH